MTVQISDTFYYNSKEYELLHTQKDNLLFNPYDYRFDPYDTSSDCWNGYLCEYTVDGGSLKLNKLYINNKDKILFNGLEPNNKVKANNIISTLISLFKNKYSYSENFDHTYTNVNLEFNYSGEMLIGRGFVKFDFDYEYYDCNYVSSPHSFKNVLKLQFDKGKLTNVIDISSELDSIRETLRLQYSSNSSENTILDKWKSFDS